MPPLESPENPDYSDRLTQSNERNGVHVGRDMQLLLSSLLLALTTVAGQAEEIVIDRVDIVESGLYRFHNIGHVIQGKNTATGIITPDADRQLLKATTTVPAKAGSSDFGVRFVVIGKPKGAKSKITFVTKFPAQGLPNPQTGKAMYQSEYEWEVEIGKPLLRTYAIDNDWEAVPGEWALEFWYLGRKLGGQTFTVVTP